MLTTHPVLSSMTWQATICSKVIKTLLREELELQGKFKAVIFHRLRSQKPAAHKFTMTVNFIKNNMPKAEKRGSRLLGC